MPEQYDVAIIGGGPAGSTCATFLRKYNPELRVVVIERDEFPRDHVGESQLPTISKVLHEMGVWDKIEAAEFPVKLGATYRWGASDKLWDFNFIDPARVTDLPRPGTFEGVRTLTAFHVDRARYDKILLDHAVELGAELRQPARVSAVNTDPQSPDVITGLQLDDGSTIQAQWYVDATGHVGVLRRALDIGVTYPQKLKNIAMWNYFKDAKWPVRVGKNTTRVMILSIKCGWLWYIPLTDDKVSVGFVCPADYYKQAGKTPEEMLTWAMSQEPLIAELAIDAQPLGDVQATKDWSFVADRLYGANWFLAGDAAGFADPILAAGLTLTHSGAREVAYMLLELFRAEHDEQWLKERYQDVQKTRINQHIRFADFWYAGNGIFTDIEQNTANIAKDAGLRLNPKDAFRWLSTGGFSRDTLTSASLIGIDFSLVMRATEKLTGRTKSDWAVAKHNVFKLNLRGAEEDVVPLLRDGRIIPTRCYLRGDKILPLAGYFQVIVAALEQHDAIHEFVPWIADAIAAAEGTDADLEVHMQQVMQTLESMLIEGWVWAQKDPKKPMIAKNPTKPESPSMIKDAKTPHA